MAQHWIFDLLPATLPGGWEIVQTGEDGRSYANRAARMTVIVSGAVEADGHRWMHVSVGRPRQMPSYEDLAFIKRVFIGPERAAIQVFPRASEHVNIHPFVLHLWMPIDHYPLPDFTGGGRSI